MLPVLAGQVADKPRLKCRQANVVPVGYWTYRNSVLPLTARYAYSAV